MLTAIQIMPFFRLRAINKMFMKSFIQSCPSEQYNSVLLPVLSQVFKVKGGQNFKTPAHADFLQMLPFMLKHMTERWAYLRSDL